MFRTLKKRVVYENPWIRVWEDQVEFSNGEPGIYGHLERRDEGALIIPMTPDGRFVVLHEWRYPIQGWTWCWPVGGSHTKGEDSLVVAKRELKEETGYTAREWIDLGGLRIDPGLSNQYERVFLARDLSLGTPRCEISEIHEVVIKTKEDIEAMIARDEIDNGWFLAGFAKAKVFLDL